MVSGRKPPWQDFGLCKPSKWPLLGRSRICLVTQAAQLKYTPASQSISLWYHKYQAYHVITMSKMIVTSASSYLLLYLNLHATSLIYTLYSPAKHIKKLIHPFYGKACCFSHSWMHLYREWEDRMWGESTTPGSKPSFPTVHFPAWNRINIIIYLHNSVSRSSEKLCFGWLHNCKVKFS